MIRRILEAREGQQQVAVIFCDLSKAFDVADHDVLSAKLKYYGIEGPVLSLLTDFLTGRRQVVVGDGGAVKSKPLKTVIGVAQGSSLSNIMFSLLLNDLPGYVRNGHVLMYADDVAAIVTASTVDHLEQRLNEVARHLSDWFKINGLVLNTNKTHYMHFDLSGHGYRELEIKMGNTRIEHVKTTSFLGFQIDSALTWENHINCLCEKIGRACFALWRISSVLPCHMVRNCYFASVHSLLQYGVELWGHASDAERVLRMQKRAMRALVRVPSETSVQPLFRTMNILTVPAMVCFQAALYAREHSEEYSRLGDGHNYGTRNAHRLRAVPRRLTKTSKLVHVFAPTVYNRLPDDVRDAVSRNSFIRRLKKWLVEQSFYKLDDIRAISLT